MKQSDKAEPSVELLDLERFVRVVRGLPTVPKSEIDKILADAKVKYFRKPVPQSRK